jgi:hypothetical protein
LFDGFRRGTEGATPVTGEEEEGAVPGAGGEEEEVKRCLIPVRREAPGGRGGGSMLEEEEGSGWAGSWVSWADTRFKKRKKIGNEDGLLERLHQKSYWAGKEKENTL